MAHPDFENHIDVHKRVAENPNTHPQTLTRLAKSPHALIKAFVAKNPKAPPTILDYLAKEHGHIGSVRHNLQRNPNTKSETHTYLNNRWKPLRHSIGYELDGEEY